LGCERAGDVNQVCMGAVMGRSVRWKLCEAVAAEEAEAAFAASPVAARAEAEAGVGVGMGMGMGMGIGGYTTTAVSRSRMVRT
jgi:hypothetical protein